jgi:acyl carrier protein
MDTTLQRLSDLLVRDYRVDRERLTPDAPLQDLGIDSLGTVELLWSVEDLFAIQLPHDPPALGTLGDVAHYVDALVAQQTGTASPTVAPHP